MHVQVDDAGNLAHAGEQRGRDRAAGLAVSAEHLHVDRRRQAEVQDLRHDVGRQEGERHAREARVQHDAQIVHVAFARLVVAPQADQDVRVGRANRGRSAVSQVDAAGRTADVVDDRAEMLGRHALADDPIHFLAESGRLLETCAGRRAEVKPELAAVHRRGRSLRPPTSRATSDARQNASDTATKTARRATTTVEQPLVRVARALNPVLEPVLQARQHMAARLRVPVDVVLVPAQQILRQRRHQRARQHVRRQHREDHGLAERHEEVARHAGEEEQRHEDDADADRRDEGRHRNLLRAVEDGLLERLALLEVAC